MITGQNGAGRVHPQPQQQFVEETVERPLSAGERAIKCGQLALWNAGTLGLVNFDLLNEDSWLREEYKAVWYGRTVTVIRRPVEEDHQDPEPEAERRLVAASSSQLSQTGGSDGTLAGRNDRRDPLVGRTFTVHLPDGKTGSLRVLDLIQTMADPALANGNGTLPQIQQASSSNALTRVWNGAGRALSSVFGSSDSTPATMQLSSTMQLVVDGVEAIFRVTISAPGQRLTPELMGSVAMSMFSQIGSGDSAPRMTVERQRCLEASPQPLMLLSSTAASSSERVQPKSTSQPVVTVERLPSIPRPMPPASPSSSNAPFTMPTTSRFGAGFGIYPGILGAFPGVASRVIMDDLDSVVQGEESDIFARIDDGEGNPAPRNQARRNTPWMLPFLMRWAAIHRQGGDLRNRQFQAQPEAQNPSWYQRFLSLITRAVTYVTTAVRNHTPEPWWTTAAPVLTEEGTVNGAQVRVDLLHAGEVEE